MNDENKIIFAVVGFIALLVFLLFLGPWLTMITWNFVMPYLFGLPKIGFWMAMAINYLAATLFKSVNYGKK